MEWKKKIVQQMVKNNTIKFNFIFPSSYSDFCYSLKVF